VQYIYKGIIALKPGHTLRELQPETPARYEHQKTNTDPGVLRTQTLAIVITHDAEITHIRDLPVIFLLDTDSGPIVVGSILYPCQAEITTTGTETQIELKASS
jgi:hypothetical protein